MRLNQLDLRSHLERLAIDLEEALLAPSTMEEARQLFCDTLKSVQEITKRAEELRITFLEEQA